MNTIKTIGVLTSGGDAPGMNAAVRSVVRCALNKGLNVIGVRKGYNGLMNGDFGEMTTNSVSDIIQTGGTALRTARCLEFKDMAGVEKAANICRRNGIDGLVVVGGDGSFRGAADLSSLGIPCIGIPGTIDNDISSTQYTVGYDTALNTVCEMVDKLRETSQSHHRCSVVEVMGRHAGHIALEAGIAVGATAILIPELEYDLQNDVISKIVKAQELGKDNFIVVVAEGVGNSQDIAAKIEEATGIETRATILGHVQRGGSPTVRDRVEATRLGYHAVELLSQGIGNRVVVVEGSKIKDYDIKEALAMKKSVDMELYKIANIVAM